MGSKIGLENHPQTVKCGNSAGVRKFLVNSEKEIKPLIEESAYAIYGRFANTENDFDFHNRKRTLTKVELDEITSLMRCVQPQDSLETLCAVQIVVSHMLGMRKLSKNHIEDQKLGLNLLRFSREAMSLLIKKRSGGVQHITVNYNYHGQEKRLGQTNFNLEE